MIKNPAVLILIKINKVYCASLSKLSHVLNQYHFIIKKGCVYCYEIKMGCYSFFVCSLLD